MWNRVKLLCIVSGIFDATPWKAQIMNEMLLFAGFMNGVTSLFVPNLCSEQDNKVSGALTHPTKSKLSMCPNFILAQFAKYQQVFWPEM